MLEKVADFEILEVMAMLDFAHRHDDEASGLI
jgi:hypothetical protein